MPNKYQKSVADNEPDPIITPMEEMDIISGMMEAANYATDESMREQIVINRKGKKLYEFFIRPLADDEITNIRKHCTPMITNPLGKKLPKISGETDLGKYHWMLIYEATVGDKGQKIWDNPQLRTLDPDPLQIVKLCLLPGEITKVTDEIMEISGYTDDSVKKEDYVKNSLEQAEDSD